LPSVGVDSSAMTLVGSTLAGFNFKTGKVLWYGTTDPGRFLAILGGHSAIFSRDNRLAVWSISDDKQLWHTDSKSAKFTAVAIDPTSPYASDLIAFTENEVFRFNVETGQPTWSAKRDGWGQLVGSTMVVTKSDRGNFDAWDIATGAKRWRFDFNGLLG